MKKFSPWSFSGISFQPPNSHRPSALDAHDNAYHLHLAYTKCTHPEAPLKFHSRLKRNWSCEFRWRRSKGIDWLWLIFCFAYRECRFGCHFFFFFATLADSRHLQFAKIHSWGPEAWMCFFASVGFRRYLSNQESRVPVHYWCAALKPLASQPHYWKLECTNFNLLQWANSTN